MTPIAKVTSFISTLIAPSIDGKLLRLCAYSQRYIPSHNFCLVLILCLILSVPAIAYPQTSGFDLVGPPLDVRVQRHEKTLPISEVPNLEPEDRLWIHPDLPESQSARYLLIVAFLRGSTNPPPDEWFTKAETWNASVRQEGLFVTVPKEAQQAVIFLAPETTGDFTTLRAAVRGRPGAFVRAAQDLQQASLDRMRLERYLNGIRSISESDPTDLQQRSATLARSLKIKLDPKCFDRPTEQQASCLTQNTDQLVLDDAHSQSMVARLANGDTADLMNRLSYSQLAGSGLYSAYVGAIVDFVRIMGSVRSAQYQYIPALAVPHGDSFVLKLNNPPSFRKPKSVLVVSLPEIRSTQPPRLRVATDNPLLCLDTPSLLLPVEGAPLVFATSFAHDMFLRLQDRSGHAMELRLETDPSRGGFVVEPAGEHRNLDVELTGTIHGQWGFDSFKGPQYQLESGHSQNWTLSANEKTALVVGREDTLHLSAPHLACVSEVNLSKESSKRKLAWQIRNPLGLEIKVPLRNSLAGPIDIEVSQYGLTNPDRIRLQSYEEAAEFNRFRLNIGDLSGTLEGKRLDEVATVELSSIRFDPYDLERSNDRDLLQLRTVQKTNDLREAEINARVVLKDGRAFDTPALVAAPRPRVTLISKGVQSDEGTPSPIHLGSDNELPVNDRIVFFVRSVAPQKFERTEKIEVAAQDESFRTLLSISDGSLVLQDAETAVGILDPEKTFGPSGFGPIRLRPIDAAGRSGDWQGLGTLIRLPEIKQIHCPGGPSKDCLLYGDNLFFITELAADPSFADAIMVPDGFTGQKLQLPHPSAGMFYFRLRDDPRVVQTFSVPTLRGLTSASLPYKEDQ